LSNKHEGIITYLYRHNAKTKANKAFLGTREKKIGENNVVGKKLVSFKVNSRVWTILMEDF
jgi:hypothetical protein